MVALRTNTPISPDRRSATRRQPTVGTTCCVHADGGIELQGLVWNLSASGVSILLSNPLESGVRYEIDLMDAGGDNPVRRGVRIAHVRRLRTGDYIIGGQFERPLSAEEMAPFLCVPAA